MRILLATIAIALLSCGSPSNHYEQQTAVIETLQELLETKYGIAGTEFQSSPRTTEINRQNPTDISWFTATWSWSNVDFSKFKGGVVEAIFKQAKVHETELQKAGFQYMAGDYYNHPYGQSIEDPVGWYRKTVTKYNKVEQTELHQSPIDRAGAELIFKRVYINQRIPGVLFATYHYFAAHSSLRIEFSYSAFPGELNEFETYQFEERLVIE